MKNEDIFLLTSVLETVQEASMELRKSVDEALQKFTRTVIEEIAKILKNQEDDVLSLSQASEILRIPKSTLYKLVESSSIPHRRLGRKILFRKTELLSWVKSLPGTTVSIPFRRKKALI